MPSPTLQLNSLTPLSGKQVATIYWCGKVADGHKGIIWSHATPGDPRSLALTVEDSMFSISTYDSSSALNRKSVAAIFDEDVCIAAVIDLNLIGADQIKGYLNGSSSGWAVDNTNSLDVFLDEVFRLGDVFGDMPTLAVQAFAVFPAAHTQAQVQAVSDSWLKMVDGH